MEPTRFPSNINDDEGMRRAKKRKTMGKKKGDSTITVMFTPGVDLKERT